eukprot:TRINITY_DN18446_c0_g1_i1.p1 TRINITY_DN18446_c0_g1~~TRINITY_DN18446_c0_g1_i1.p1  ORF type:complete len:111 (+),score=22.24 TRINITY_DN18446_c0_g1_i1:78-410(+)
MCIRDSLSPDHLSISRLITDVLSCLLCLIAALVALATGGGVSGIFAGLILLAVGGALGASSWFSYVEASSTLICLLYTSDAADEEDSGDLGGRRFIYKKKNVGVRCRLRL